MPPCILGGRGHFLLSRITRCPRLILYFPSPCSQPLLQGVLGPVTGAWCLETKVWELGVLIASGTSLLLGPFRGQSWDDIMGVSVPAYLSVHCKP